jgi:hypothetical protein
MNSTKVINAQIYYIEWDKFCWSYSIKKGWTLIVSLDDRYVIFILVGLE